MEKRVSYHENMNRTKNLIVQGVPDNGNDEMSVSLIAAELGLKNFSIEIWVDYLKRFKRNTSRTYPGSLLIRFSNLRMRNSFMSAYISYIKVKNLQIACINTSTSSGSYPNNGSIFINEHLHNKTHKLWIKARYFVKQKFIKAASMINS